ncbi:relaxase/mobilization nuclease [Streptomyces sp. GZWMJZ-114]|uniref:relaxase/mobilization nuclease n=1 Tax=Streptomyces sp. GZWMJZ-114 TaxID=2494734 RepID=UPI0010138765|nr:relaxase/mobilization nuclease [Streptomyces sp. GZWMJZ-114]
MITQLADLRRRPDYALADALGRELPRGLGGPVETRVIAHGPAVERYASARELATWTTGQWALELEDPLDEYPKATSSRGDRNAILHLQIQLHPDDRRLGDEEWKQLAGRFAHAVGIQEDPSSADFVWIAVQAQPGRLDLIANLIHEKGSWYTPPAGLTYRIEDEARSIEAQLGLVAAPRSHRDVVKDILAVVLEPEHGPLAAVRVLLTHAAARATQDGSNIIDAPGIAGRLGNQVKYAERLRDRLLLLAGELDGGPARREPSAPAPVSAPHERRGHTL